MEWNRAASCLVAKRQNRTAPNKKYSIHIRDELVPWNRSNQLAPLLRRLTPSLQFVVLCMATPLELQFTGSRTSIRQLATSIRQPDWCLALAAASKVLAARPQQASSKRAAPTTKELVARPPQRVRKRAARLQRRVRRQQARGAGREAAGRVWFFAWNYCSTLWPLI